MASTARYDKYDPVSGGFRAKLAAAWGSADVGEIIGVGLNTSGQVVKGIGNTGVRGVVVVNRPMAAGDVVDVMTSGEIADVADKTAGTNYFADPTTGVLEASATGDYYVGTTVEATRLVVRADATVV